jgi:hypothetical protein
MCVWTRHRPRGFKFIELDLDRSIEEQLPLDGILHKIPEVSAQANLGNAKAQAQLERIQVDIG